MKKTTEEIYVEIKKKMSWGEWTNSQYKKQQWIPIKDVEDIINQHKDCIHKDCNLSKENLPCWKVIKKDLGFI